MSVHPNGTGTGWTNVEAVDVDQPHGKDYLYSQHIAKGVRKRINKEHKAFGDTTAGGEHLPGGCRILGITDATADITAGAGDKTGIDITDGLFKGRGLIYDQTTNALWCYTADGTTTDNPYELKWSARCICKGDDFTWTGGHQFDASVYFKNPIEASTVDISGHLYVDSSCDVSAFKAAGIATFGADVSIVANLETKGSLDVSDAANFYSAVNFNSNAVFKNYSYFTAGATFALFGDWSGRSNNTTYTAATDGIVYAINSAANSLIMATPTGTTRVSQGRAAGLVVSGSMVVKKTNTWDVSGASTVYWIPIGDNT